MFILRNIVISTLKSISIYSPIPDNLHINLIRDYTMKPPITYIVHQKFCCKNEAAVFLFAALACHSESLNSNNSSNNNPLQKQIAKNFPRFEAHSVIESDNYAAVILTMPRAGDDEHGMKVAIFHRNTDQSYELISSSKI